MEFDPHILNAKEIPIEYFEASTQIINEIMSQRPQKTVLDQNAVQNFFFFEILKSKSFRNFY